MGRGTGASGKEEVSEEAGGGGMGVLYVERGMGKVGGAKVGVELEAAGGDLKAGADEAKLAKGLLGAFIGTMYHVVILKGNCGIWLGSWCLGSGGSTTLIGDG